MATQVSSPCNHCEQPTTDTNWQGLCPTCRRHPRIAILYLKIKRNSPEHEANLRRLRSRTTNACHSLKG